MKMKLPRVGLYAWGGPGTVRLLHTKFADPLVDEQSFLGMYDEPWLKQAKKLVGATDMWVTYSWGFSDSTEQEDRAFITDRLPNFAKHKIRPYAYIQGTNLVTDEFPITGKESPFCRDPFGQLIPYSRGRSMTCPNNPVAREIIANRVKEACKHDFHAIFVDNIFLGLPAWYFRSNLLSFCGCSCEHCQSKFKQEYGYDLPKRTKVGKKKVDDYLKFRTQSLKHLIAHLSDIAHQTGKEFGVNLYDPFWHTTDIMFGYNFHDIEQYLDYYLIENHHLLRGNQHLVPLIKSTKKPVFIVSYKQGIGFDEEFSQKEINLWWSDALRHKYTPCLKATEYVTRGQWHGLRWENLGQPQKIERDKDAELPQFTPVKPSSRLAIFLVPLVDRILPSLLRKYYNSAKTFDFVNRFGIYQKLVQSPKLFEDFFEMFPEPAEESPIPQENVDNS